MRNEFFLNFELVDILNHVTPERDKDVIHRALAARVVDTVTTPTVKGCITFRQELINKETGEVDSKNGIVFVGADKIQTFEQARNEITQFGGDLPLHTSRRVLGKEYNF